MRFSYMRFSLLLIAVFNTCFGFAQTSDEELAARFYSSGEYEKAVSLYKQLLKSDPNSVYIYENYLNSLIALEEKREAISLVKKQMRRDPKSLNFTVDYGYVLEQFGEKDKASEHFKDLIKEHSKDAFGVNYLAQAFLKRQYTDWAILSFESAVDLHGFKYYWSSLLNLYRSTGEFEKATALGLEVLRSEPKRANTIFYHFSRMLEKEASANYIQTQTLSYIQKYPNVPAYSELLLNIYLEQKKYRAAFGQARAMDLRLNENGRRLLSLAKTCINNEAYDVAADCYQNLIDRGPNTLYYIDGRVGLLNARYLMVNNDPNSSLDVLKTLIVSYEAFLGDYGYSKASSSAMRRLAELYLFHTYETEKGISILNELIQIRNLGSTFLGEAKLLLGDAYLIKGDIWEAKLLYGQVDKDFKEDPLGQEAKFRNARLSYFNAEFDWANDQLDILKTATSQLIANNALDLALLIQDNAGLDSNYDAMREYAHAEFLLFQNKTKACLDVLDALPFQFPNHSLSDELLFLKARVMEKEKRFEEALQYYERVYMDYSQDILADNALFKAAYIQEHIMQNPATAMQLYEKLILDYNSSLYVVESRKKYQSLKDKIIQ